MGNELAEQSKNNYLESKKAELRQLKHSERIYNRQLRLVENYPLIEDFFQEFSPNVQDDVCEDVKDCYMGNYPTLFDVKTVYSDVQNAASAWLVTQICDLGEYCGVRDKMNERQYVQLSNIIAREYSHYKVSEFMLFCNRFKAGHYGEFYGNIDPMKITNALRQFDDERYRALERYRQLENDERDKHQNEGAVSREEYNRMMGYGEKYNPMKDIRLGEKKEQPKKNVQSVAEIRKLAIAAMGEPTESVRATMVQYFTNKYGETPSAYLEAHKDEKSVVSGCA